jgi:tyrosyl-tRNA synthetase
VYKEFVIERPAKWGGNLVFTSYADLEKAFAEKQVHPADLKAAVAMQLNRLLEPIRRKFATPELQALTAAAYPEEHQAKLEREAAKATAPAPATSSGAEKKSKWF